MKDRVTLPDHPAPAFPHWALCPTCCGAWGSPEPVLDLHQFQLSVPPPAEPKSPEETELGCARRLARGLWV